MWWRVINFMLLNWSQHLAQNNGKYWLQKNRGRGSCELIEQKNQNANPHGEKKIGMRTHTVKELFLHTRSSQLDSDPALWQQCRFSFLFCNQHLKIRNQNYTVIKIFCTNLRACNFDIWSPVIISYSLCNYREWRPLIPRKSLSSGCRCLCFLLTCT